MPHYVPLQIRPPLLKHRLQATVSEFTAEISPKLAIKWQFLIDYGSIYDCS